MNANEINMTKVEKRLREEIKRRRGWRNFHFECGKGSAKRGDIISASSYFNMADRDRLVVEILESILKD